MKNLLIISFLLLLGLNGFGQENTNCIEIDTKIDSIQCDSGLLISEVNYCINSSTLISGISYFKNGKEFLCFDYKYNRKGKLILVKFRTYHYTKGGWTTDHLVAKLNYSKDKKLTLTSNYTFNLDFLEQLIQYKN